MRVHRIMIGISVLGMLFGSGCATSGKSTLFGSGLGAGLGAGIGAMVDPGKKGKDRIRNVFIGAAAGSLAGAASAYFGHGVVEGREKSAFEKGKKEGEISAGGAEAGAQGAPILVPPRIESRFVDEQIRGNVFIPAHFEYVIVEPARWSR